MRFLYLLLLCWAFQSCQKETGDTLVIFSHLPTVSQSGDNVPCIKSGSDTYRIGIGDKTYEIEKGKAVNLPEGKYTIDTFDVLDNRGNLIYDINGEQEINIIWGGDTTFTINVACRG